MRKIFPEWSKMVLFKTIYAACLPINAGFV